jgi:hypothetical protein
MKPRIVKFRIDRDLDAGLKRLRDRNGIPAAEAIRRAIREYLKKQKAAALLFLPLVLASAGARAAEDPVAAALRLLGADAPVAPIAFDKLTPDLGGNTDGRTIFINVRSPKYKRAMKGDAIALAGVIAHEGWHVAHGPAEAPAYAEQLRVLRALGARRSDVEAVARAAAQIGGLR